MGNGTSRVVGCFVPFNGKNGVDLEFLEPLDEGLGHSFCYVRPSIFDSPAITPSNSERPNKTFPETTFKTISGASVSANVSTARTGNQSALFASDMQEPAASFESTSSFAAIPLQPVPRGSGPLNGFMSGPLERGFASGPLERGSGFISGPIEKGRIIRREYVNSRNLQWAHGKAGEDRVHVVLSEEQGWLFIGIYDGFSGPDAPDFLMSHLYRAIDKELEGVLWDYEDKSVSGPIKPEISKCRNADVGSECGKENQPNSSQVTYCGLEKACNPGVVRDQSSNCEIVEEYDDVKSNQQQSSNCKRPSISGSASASIPTANLTGQGRKSMRLYELLQMESCNDLGFISMSLVESKRRNAWSCQPSSDPLDSRLTLLEQQRSCTLNNDNGDGSNQQVEGPSTSGEDGGVRFESSNPEIITELNVSQQQQSTRKSIISSKIRKMYRKQKSLRKKLFPWSYDWHREEICADERVVEPPGPFRRCKSGIVDHDAVLKAMSRALECTEEAYMEMVEKNLDKNAELALMGSCVLVMLMKDQDVYVMNLGDSRAILAQERPNDRHPNPSFAKDDLRHRNRSRESLVRMELDRISEESPIHNQNSQEVFRVKAEHPDDNQAILNDRVKGQLKVTRAFGAGFLKKPTCNEALLEIFRINYMGTNPYVSCIPSVVHHRLSSSDRFLVLSSDGLYQYFSNEEVVAHVTWFMENVPEGDPAQYLIAELLFRAAKKNGMDFHELLDIPNGDRRKYHDDVSVMVVSLEGRIWRSSG
ncbi:hypothetical protein GH714_022023 [Hevea brasiliensis]|uniref:PPM-type phosphatase domain-containing protein n=1 Tax=Hevea brasiliensis TaxID=3981 RepID=A0A6A6NIH3_HEVBR|nr:hypothetical protein GH714_022023 [Hevea brasiliensis]